MRRTMGWVACAAIVCVACGDGETTDQRGYTKAPLETPGVVIDAESRSEMDRLGVPNRPRGQVLTPAAADTAAGG